MELISVIVPVYNIEIYLRECIDSLINQTYKNIEIIIVDDGSTDSSSIICDEYAKKYSFIKAYHKTNGGLSDARNYGIVRATGKYLCFVDSDDFVENNFIYELWKNIKNYKCQISSCAFLHYYSNNVKIYKCKKNITKKYLKEDALKYLNIDGYFSDSVCNKMFDKVLFNEIKFPIAKKYEDRRTIYRLIDVSNGLAYTSKPLYNYRQREGSIIHNPKNDDELIQATKEIYDFIEKKYKNLLKYAKQHLLFAYITIYNKRLIENNQSKDKMYIESKKYFKNVSYYGLKILKRIQLWLYINNIFIYNKLFSILKRR